jgi:hypothetical protein
MTTNLQFNGDLESNITSYTTGGQILITEQGNQYVIKSDGSKLKITDIITVSTLPVSPIPSKIYILSSQNYSMNYYDGSAWHTLGSSQISIGTTAPTDISKLFLDITDKTKPILKWYDLTTTSWINISSTQVQSDWNQTDNTKADYIKGKPTNLLITSNIKAGANVNLTTNGNDVTIGVIGSNATSINNINVDDSLRSNGTGIFYNSSTGKYENATVNVTGIVGSSQITVAGQNVTIPSGSEVTFNHPTSTNIIPSIEEQISGSNVTDTHVDFSDSSKYTLQDNGKILIGNNKVELDTYTKLLLHMDSSSFIDVCGHTVTNNGVTYNTTTYKFGTGSAYFNGSSNLSIATNSDFDFGINNFNIDMLIYPTSFGTFNPIYTKRSIGGTSNIIIAIESGVLAMYATSNDTSWDISSSTKFGTLQLNQWNHISVCRYGNSFYGFVNGIKSNNVATSSLAISTNASNVLIGGETGYYFNGYIDEIRITKGKPLWLNNFIPPTSSQIGTPYLIPNIPTYLQTTGSSDYSLTTIDTITSLTIPCTIPTNTNIKCLFSVDNKNTWLYYDGTSIKKFIGDITQDWSITSSSYTQLQTYFSNKSIASLISDLNSLGIVPVSLDFCFQLLSSDLTLTPSISPITMVYITTSHTEFASMGSYDEQYVKFGIKKVSNSEIAVKNLSNKTRIIKVNVVTSA